jgi:TIR domain-containing protein
VTESGKGVFLSYASQDAEAAQHLCEALRNAGVEVWFDQSELRGGDTWDASIRKQIKNCALFIPVISRNTHARDEGYFRLEWRLAVDRSHPPPHSIAVLPFASHWDITCQIESEPIRHSPAELRVTLASTIAGVAVSSRSCSSASLGIRIG